MSSRRRKPDRPIEKVELKVVFAGSQESLKRLKDRVPSATMRNGRCEVLVEGGAPQEVAERARQLLESASEVSGRSKRV